jgi:Carboxypeptidase regulatory-like domain
MPSSTGTSVSSTSYEFLSLEFASAIVCVTIAAMMLAVATPSWAQSDGSIRGSLIDPLGARVSSAIVNLTLGGKVVREGMSDARGDFAFDGLAEGRYQIEVTSPGFQSRTTDPIFVGRSGKVSTSRSRSVRSSRTCR